MRCVIALVVTICAAAYSADWYVGSNIGHAFGFSSCNRIDWYSKGDSEAIKSTPAEQAQGMMEGGMHGGMYSSFGVGVDLSILYSPGKSNHFFTGVSDDETSEIIDSSIENIKTSVLYVVPSISYRYRFGNLYPYVRIGIAFGCVFRKYDIRDKLTANDTTRLQEWDVSSSKTSIGPSESIGIEYLFSKRLGIQLEADARQMSSNIYWYEYSRKTQSYDLSAVSASLGITYHL